MARRPSPEGLGTSAAAVHRRGAGVAPRARAQHRATARSGVGSNIVEMIAKFVVQAASLGPVPLLSYTGQATQVRCLAGQGRRQAALILLTGEDQHCLRHCLPPFVLRLARRGVLAGKGSQQPVQQQAAVRFLLH